MAARTSRASVDEPWQRLLAAVRRRRARGLFPPVADAGPDALLREARQLGGARDARALQRLLSRPRFAPLRELIAELDARCARWTSRHGAALSAQLLRIDNGALMGPLLQEALCACAFRPAKQARRLLEILWRGFCAALETFLRRLQRDLAARIFPRARPASRQLRAVQLVAHMEETHHGRQFVLEVALDDGSRWAYKPRPCEGEELLMQAAPTGGAPRSLFAMINAVRPASGAPQLPTLRLVRGRGRDRQQYAWQEWVRPAQTAVVATRGAHRLRACRLRPRQAERFWYQAGCLAAASLAVGATDLFADNLRVGRRRGQAGPMAYPIDLEMIGYPLRSLIATGLIGDARDRGNHHVGFERLPRFCTVGGPLACFFDEPDRGEPGLRLRVRRQGWTRREAPALAVDQAGRAGYAAYLPWLLRGLFDCWVTMMQRRAELLALLRRWPEPLVRVVLRPTDHYARFLDAMLTSAGAAPPDLPRGVTVAWSNVERAQLAGLDVPHFSRRAGGPLLGQHGQPVRPRGAALPAPEPLRERVGRLELSLLGLALREAVAFAQRDGAALAQGAHQARGAGVTLSRGAGPRAGAIEFTWPEAARTVRVAWKARGLRVELLPLPRSRARAAVSPASARAVKRRLHQLDRIDRGLRERWQRDGFRDRALERTLERLVATGIEWLQEVLQEHGFPGRSLVGEQASAAACRLVQHADRFPAVQVRYLRLAARAVARGDLAPRHLAYLTDQVRLRQGKKQLYGTKFRRQRGQLVPFPIHAPARVDERRARVGLPSLASYARRLTRVFVTPELS